MSIDHNEVLTVAQKVRQFLEPKWETEDRLSYGSPLCEGERPSKNMCLVSSCFMKRVLSEKFPNVTWRVVGGYYHDQHGILVVIDSASGQPGEYRSKYGHHWVQDANNTIALDVTQDQFNGPPVVVIDLTQQSPTTSNLVRHWDSHTEDVVSNLFINVVDKWMKDWDMER